MADSATPAATKGAAKAAPQVSFRSLTQPTVKATGYVQTQAMETAAVDLPQWQIPANNILREVILEVAVVAAGNAAAVAFQPDAPLNIFSTVNFADAGGTSIVGSFDSYVLSMVQKWGGYAQSADPRSSAVYKVTAGAVATGGSANLVLRIPVEVVNRTGFGSLPNTSTNSPLNLSLTLQASGKVYSTAPTTLPTVTVTGRLGGYWRGPSAQAPQPKSMGTTQYWNRASIMGLDGSVDIQMPNLGLGNPIRNLAYIAYATGGARSNSLFPDPFTLNFRGNFLLQTSQNLWADQMSRDFGYSSATYDGPDGLDTGVYVVPFDKDFTNAPGAELGAGYLNTAVGDSVELLGSFSASTSLYYLVNFLAVKGAAQAAATPAS